MSLGGYTTRSELDFDDVVARSSTWTGGTVCRQIASHHEGIQSDTKCHSVVQIGRWDVMALPILALKHFNQPNSVSPCLNPSSGSTSWVFGFNCTFPLPSKLCMEGVCTPNNGPLPIDFPWGPTFSQIGVEMASSSFLCFRGPLFPTSDPFS